VQEGGSHWTLASVHVVEKTLRNPERLRGFPISTTALDKRRKTLVSFHPAEDRPVSTMNFAIQIEDGGFDLLDCVRVDVA
jgi:hypothetical protein